MGITERFIASIKSHELLYDNDNPNYGNYKMKEGIWEDLSQEFHCDAKKKWHTLRDRFVRERRKRSTIANYQCPWSLYNDMNFIDNHIKIRRKLQKMSCSVFVPGEDEDEDNEEVINETDIDFYTVMGDLNNSEVVETKSNKSTEHTITDSFNFPSQQKAKAKKMDFTQENMLKILRSLQKITENIECTNDNDDEDTAFIELIAKKMRRMSSVEKSMFQVEVLKKAVEISSKTDV